jgi:hypothetical protein
MILLALVAIGPATTSAKGIVGDNMPLAKGDPTAVIRVIAPVKAAHIPVVSPRRRFGPPSTLEK